MIKFWALVSRLGAARLLNIAYPILLLGIISSVPSLRQTYVYHLALANLLKLISIAGNDSIGIVKVKEKHESNIYFESILVVQLVLVLIGSVIIKLSDVSISYIFLLAVSFDLFWIHIAKNELTRFIAITTIFRLLASVILFFYKTLLAEIDLMFVLGTIFFIQNAILVYYLRFSLKRVSLRTSKNYYVDTYKMHISKYISAGNDSVLPLIIKLRYGLSILYIYEITRKVVELTKLPPSVLNTSLLAHKENDEELSYRILGIRLGMVLVGILLLYLSKSFWLFYFELKWIDVELYFIYIAALAIITVLSYYFTGYFFIINNRQGAIVISQFFPMGTLLILFLLRLELKELLMLLCMSELLRLVYLFLTSLKRA